MSLGKEAAMNAELRSSARRTGCADARREPCLTERSQQCKGGLGAWQHCYTVKERRDPRMQGKEMLARQGNVVSVCGQHRHGTGYVKARVR